MPETKGEDPKGTKNIEAPVESKQPACGHSPEFIKLPPPFQTLIRDFPRITAYKGLDRSIPRCKLCDLIAAQIRADKVEYPPPTYKSPVDELEKQIKLAEKMIAEGKQKEELEETLPEMKKKLADSIRDMDKGILQAWKEHWGIWGPGEGPEMEDELVVEEPNEKKAKEDEEVQEDNEENKEENEELEIDVNIPLASPTNSATATKVI